MASAPGCELAIILEQDVLTLSNRWIVRGTWLTGLRSRRPSSQPVRSRPSSRTNATLVAGIRRLRTNLRALYARAMTQAKCCWARCFSRSTTRSSIHASASSTSTRQPSVLRSTVSSAIRRCCASIILHTRAARDACCRHCASRPSTVRLSALKRMRAS